jgi:hypothetical protein
MNYDSGRLESRPPGIVKDVAEVSLDEELDRLQAEADAFDGTQKPSPDLGHRACELKGRNHVSSRVA